MADRLLFAEESAAVEQDPGDVLAHLLQSLQGDWLPAYAYIQGKVALQLDFWIWSEDVEVHVDHYVMVLQRAPGVDVDLLDGRFAPMEVQAPEFRDLVLVDGDEGGEKRPVFVFVGEGSESGEDVRAWAVRSLVWLAHFKEPQDSRMETIDLPVPPLALSMAALVRRLDIEYWKGVAVRGFEPVGLDQDPDEMIEGCPKVLDVVTGDGAPFQWRLLDNLESPECLRGLHVYLGDESVGLGFALGKGIDLRPERFEMRFRSLQLGDAPG